MVQSSVIGMSSHSTSATSQTCSQNDGHKQETLNNDLERRINAIKLDKELRQQIDEKKKHHDTIKKAQSEELQIMENYSHLLEQRENQRKQEISQIVLERQKVAADVFSKIKEKNIKSDEMLETRLLVQEKYEREQYDENVESNLKKIQLGYENFRKDNEKLIELKHKEKQDTIKNEMELRDMLLLRFAEEDQIEQMNTQNRRLKMHHHRLEVEQLIEQRRVVIQKEKEHKNNERQETQLKEMKEKEVVNDERQVYLINSLTEFSLDEILHSTLLTEKEKKIIVLSRN